jgi:hypothetical protein
MRRHITPALFVIIVVLVMLGRFLHELGPAGRQAREHARPLEQAPSTPSNTGNLTR